MQLMNLLVFGYTILIRCGRPAKEDLITRLAIFHFELEKENGIIPAPTDVCPLKSRDLGGIKSRETDGERK